MKKIAAIITFVVLLITIPFLKGSVFAKQNLKLNKTSLVITVGESTQLELQGISRKKRNKVLWKSSNSQIILVNKKGNITAKNAGNAVVTATFQGKKYKCKVRIVSKTNGNNDKKEITSGTSYYRDFLVDNIFHSEKNVDIHYNVYFPDSYNEKSKYALFITLPGYQGLYFQGVAENIKTEDFGFEARKYHSDMIILAPQLEDWEETSADQTIALVEYFLSHYNIDSDRVYINGYSGGGETLSIVLGKRPELFTAALMCSSQWDGEYQPVVLAKTPVYFVIGESDEYYGSKPFKEAYEKLYELYRKQGLSKKEIDHLLVLDIKDSSYFQGTGITYQHGGGYLFCRDKNIMGWLFQWK